MIDYGYQILVVEDEAAMANLLEQAFTESGYRVSVATDGLQGIKMAPHQDALIVDVMMPNMSGFQMVKDLRESGNTVPVLFLTAKDSVSDRVTGLDIGGDDYLVKPFKLDELFARVRALIRRSQTSSEVLTFSDLWINVRTRKARRGQRWLYLSNTEFAILEMFMRQPGEILSKERFLHEIWNESDPRDNNVVEVFMRYLRIKLETMGDTRLIHTVRGRGYLLEIRPEQS